MSFKGQKTGLEIVGVKLAMIVDLKHVLVKFFPELFALYHQSNFRPIRNQDSDDSFSIGGLIFKFKLKSIRTFCKQRNKSIPFAPI